MKIRKPKTLFSVFLPSPFTGLAEHAEMAGKLVHRLREAVEAFCDGDQGRIRKLEEEVSREEHSVDLHKRKIRENLPKGAFLPVDRSDLLAFLKPQDSIADFAEDVVHIMSLRPGKVPEEIREGLSELVDAVVRTVDAYVEMVGKLSRVAKFSFRGKDIAQVMEEISRVEELEHETDIIEMSLGRKIFAAEGQVGPVGVYHLSELAKAIGEVANNAARAADRLRTMISRR